MLRLLKNLGLIFGTIEELYDNDIHKIFMPHGLGHFIGYWVHDIGVHKYKELT